MLREVSEEYRKMYNVAEEKLFRKGFIVDNMLYDKSCYEVSPMEGKVIIDNLSLHQLSALADMLDMIQ